MSKSIPKFGVIIGSTLITLLLRGSTRSPATSPQVSDSAPASEVKRRYVAAMELTRQSRYDEARDQFTSAATLAETLGATSQAAAYWNSAGGCALAVRQFQVALVNFRRAKQIAEASGDITPLLATMNNLASLYISIGQFENAIRTVRTALAAPAPDGHPEVRSKLRFQLAKALAETDRFNEARPLYYQVVDELTDENDLPSAARALSAFGYDSLRAGSLAEAEWALSQALHIVRIHRIPAEANILAGLAKLKGEQGDARSASMLFDEALAAPPNLSPRWMIFADRARFRLTQGDLTGAVADLRESRRIALKLREDIFPADQDRVALENGLGFLFENLVDSGNRLARETGDEKILQETFDAAEQDRLWSLRTLVPVANDWRTKLPEHYWTVLSSWQALERQSLSQSQPQTETMLASLHEELQQMEVSAAGPGAAQTDESALTHLRTRLGADSVVLGFHISKTSSWVWAMDRAHVNVYPLPAFHKIQAEIKDFERALQQGTDATSLGNTLYRDLFGAVPASYLRHAHWRLEPDGPLYDLSFAALVSRWDGARPRYLVEDADLELIPGALLTTAPVVPAEGEFLGIADPVYNPADSRYRGSRTTELSLARLPNTSDEIQSCARAWHSPHPRLLVGPDSQLGSVRSALQSKPSIIHFATHVVAGSGNFQSGLIALSLDSQGRMGLLGPEEIVARPVSADLIVMDGCHSAQGQSLSNAGLMGLTRAWIGAGAASVIATQWDVPDDDAQSLMVGFYRALKADPRRNAAAALRQAQLLALRNSQPGQSPLRWAGYFLLSRSL